MLRGRAKRAREYPLSDGDIRKMLGDDIKILTYDQLANIRDYNELFDAKGRSILLYPTVSPTTGHWVCLLNKQDGIEFFDPYGNKPDDISEYISRPVREELNIRKKMLLPLLKQSGKPIVYNTHAFQKDRNDIATCGRHAVSRCLYAPKTLDEYKYIVDSSNLAPDDFVLGITYDKIGK